MENDFYKQQQSAVQKMREMNSRSAFINTQNPVPPKKSPPKPQENTFFKGLNIPFLDSLSTDGDMALILGLLLILISEKTDKTLLFALIYILI